MIFWHIWEDEDTFMIISFSLIPGVDITFMFMYEYVQLIQYGMLL